MQLTEVGMRVYGVDAIIKNNNAWLPTEVLDNKCVTILNVKMNVRHWVKH